MHAFLSASLIPQDDDSDEDDDNQPTGDPLHAVQAPAATTSEETDGTLPSALDVLDPSVQPPSFLHIDGPEFDASKGFRPPPVTAADLGPASGESSFRVPNASVVQARHESYYHPSDRPRPNGGGRLHGSVCLETDDERGRRVKYGAHAMLKADPWSACNPNYSMSDSSVTRGKDRRVGSGKRPRGE